MEPTQELIDEIERERIERARQASPEQKMRAGPELFDFWLKLVAGFVRSRNPDATDEDIRREVLSRLAMARKLDESDWADPPLYVECKP